MRISHVKIKGLGPSLKNRKLAAIVILTLAIMVAGYVSIPTRNTRLSPFAPTENSDNLLVSVVAFLSHLELAHIVTHLALFSLVAFLVGPWGAGNRTLAWQYVIWGSLLMELTQLIIGSSDDTVGSWVSSTVFDFCVNAIAGWGGIWLSVKFQHHLSQAPITEP